MPCGKYVEWWSIAIRDTDWWNGSSIGVRFLDSRYRCCTVYTSDRFVQNQQKSMDGTEGKTPSRLYIYIIYNMSRKRESFVANFWLHAGYMALLMFYYWEHCIWSILISRHYLLSPTRTWHEAHVWVNYVPDDPVTAALIGGYHGHHGRIQLITW